jgi:hypothetical protein
LDAGQKLDDLLPDLGCVCTEDGERLSTVTFAFANEPEKKVLSPDVVVTEPESFTQR